MKLVKLIPVFLLLAGIHLQAQSPELVDLVNSYLDANGSTKQYSDAYDELLNLMERQFPKSDKNSNGWLYLERNKTKAIFEIKDMLTAVYLDNFSEKELRGMSNFYASETGKQLVTDKDKLSESQKAEIKDFYDSDVGLSLTSKQMALTEEIQAVSELWSRDLYQTASLLLKE
ncbi:DUF2059 domain-containing protein [Croceivirga thetidis]|uniref:DUF2059 domain-containing protein n=1 Tax=Croceivirga thetidis TaxID=2721623 RepID=A0ABX1GT85_9FLAO|nr:DUF2059 domain-containing protein [Croceivirga thetidis]NKI33167.1 DUF2059 domain-containing protein [Croceivirga thetidis]